MKWTNLKDVLTTVVADNTRTGVQVNLTLLPYGISIASEQSGGFFKFRAFYVMSYLELESVENPKDLILSHVNEVRARMIRDIKAIRGKTPTEITVDDPVTFRREG